MTECYYRGTILSIYLLSDFFHVKRGTLSKAPLYYWSMCVLHIAPVLATYFKQGFCYLPQ